MNKHVTYILVGLSLALTSCAPKNGLEAHTDSSLAGPVDYKDVPEPVTETPPTTGDGGAPEPADPPPITLGSYPWMMTLSYERSEDGKFLHIKALVLDEDDPPGIPVFSGYIINTKFSPYQNLKVPIKVLNRFTGEVEFTVPAVWANSSKTHGILTGPGYTDHEFEVCDLGED